jgi:predicted DNA-binding transcriptional regulator AlpA
MNHNGSIQDIPNHFITAIDLQLILGVKKTTLYKMIKENKLPPSISIFTRRKIWKRSAIIKFISNLE